MNPYRRLQPSFLEGGIYSALKKIALCRRNKFRPPAKVNGKIFHIRQIKSKYRFSLSSWREPSRSLFPLRHRRFPSGGQGKMEPAFVFGSWVGLIHSAVSCLCRKRHCCLQRYLETGGINSTLRLSPHGAIRLIPRVCRRFDHKDLAAGQRFHFDFFYFRQHNEVELFG